ncbi:lipopolysaccharide biosynthesis protein WzzE [Legionella steelei]|uniref:Lipopolysaccharide biosynthesis protein WzzE n=1 Tax=Legionella steelei TaxID=947033 RepID=A0A0W0ZKU4_9GAMM|nr:lipopolysaccharide biosynthesis protein WzzE [Legionella steelei]
MFSKGEKGVHTEKLIGNHSEITMNQLLCEFYQHKKTILLVTLLSIALGIIYILVSAPVYQASAHISAPMQGDIVAFNKGNLWGDNKTIKPMSVDSVYAVFSKELLSASNKKYFFQEYYLPLLKQKPQNNASLKKLYDAFSKKFSIKIDNKLSPGQKATGVQYDVMMKSTNPEQAAAWVKQFIDLAKERTISSLIGDIEKQRAVVIYQLTHKIDIISRVAKENRTDQIAKLHEALKIAQSAKMNSALMQYTLASESNMAYMLGANVLQAQIKNLSERQSDNEFIPDLRTLQSKLDFYSSFVINPKDVAVFSSDGTVEISGTPISPKKEVVIATSILLGLIIGMLGVMLCFVIRVNKAV